MRWIVVLVTAVVLSSCGGSEPDDAVVDFFDALASAEVDKAMGYVSSSFAANIGGEAVVRGVLTEAAREERPDSWSMEILEVEERGDIATVTASISLDGEQTTKKFDLVREGGQWKLTEF